MVPILILLTSETPRNKTRPTTQVIFVFYLQLSTFVGNLHKDRAIVQSAISSAVDSNIDGTRVVPLRKQCLVQISRTQKFAEQKGQKKYSVRGWKVPLKYYVGINRAGRNLVKSRLEEPLREYLCCPLVVAVPGRGCGGDQGPPFHRRSQEGGAH